MLTNPFSAAFGWLLVNLPTQVLIRKGTHPCFCEPDSTQYLRLHRAVKPTVTDTVVFVHGGGGQRGTAVSWDWVGQRLSSHGITTAVVSYPLCVGPHEWRPDVARQIVRNKLPLPPTTLFAAASFAVFVAYGLQPSLTRALMCTLLFMALMIAYELFWKRVYPALIDLVAPYDLQTPGTTFGVQVQTVAAQLDALHKRVGGDLVVIGHEHGALLAQQAMKELQPSYVRVFFSVAGLHDVAALDEAVGGLSRRFLRATYIEPVFGSAVQDGLVSAMKRDKSLPDSIQVVIIVGAGSSSALIAQADHLCRALNTCVDPKCRSRRDCANKKHARRASPTVVGPMGMGTGTALLMDSTTVFVYRRLLNDSIPAPN